MIATTAATVTATASAGIHKNMIVTAMAKPLERAGQIFWSNVTGVFVGQDLTKMYIALGSVVVAFLVWYYWNFYR